MTAEPVWSATLAAAVLETVLEAALRLDPVTLERLADLAGKTIAITVDGLGWTFYCQPDASGVRVRTQYAAVPAVEIRGPPLALAQLWRNPERGGAEVRITGDAGLARRLQNTLAGLEIDWEEQLAGLVGDVAAHQLGRLGRGARAWSRQAAETARHTGADYLQYELQLLPPRWKIEQFLNAVDDLREDADRLQARLARLHRLTGNDPDLA